MLPDFSFEEVHWNNGLRVIAGADEVGRGAFAGPVVAAVVIFAPTTKMEVEINDSKKLTHNKRERASRWIKKHAQNYAIGEGSVEEINFLGIVPATHLAFLRAIENCSLKIDRFLVDAFYLPKIKKSLQTPIIKGDTKSLSIAAASIIAKVYRDDLMIRLSEKHGEYQWHQNKGYGTLAHRNALQKLGPTVHHRNKFIRSIRLIRN